MSYKSFFSKVSVRSAEFTDLPKIFVEERWVKASNWHLTQQYNYRLPPGRLAPTDYIPSTG